MAFCPFLSTIENTIDCKKEECEVFDTLHQRCAFVGNILTLNELPIKDILDTMEGLKDIINPFNELLKEQEKLLERLLTSSAQGNELYTKLIDKLDETFKKLHISLDAFKSVLEQIQTEQPKQIQNILDTLNTLSETIKLESDKIIKLEEIADNGANRLSELITRVEESNKQIHNFLLERAHYNLLSEAREHNNQGVAYYYKNAYEAAIIEFEKALQKDPELVEVYNNLGLTYSKLRQNEKATEYFQKALELNPNFAEAYANLGVIYHLESKYTEAIEEFNKALIHKPDSAIGYTNLGNAYNAIGETVKAIKAWKQAIELDPANEEAQKNLKLYQEN